MNKVAARRFLAAAFSAWGAALWAWGGVQAIREQRQREIWTEASEEKPDGPTMTSAQTADLNGVSER